jgi:hypothetical protein
MCPYGVRGLDYRAISMKCLFMISSSIMGKFTIAAIVGNVGCRHLLMMFKLYG